VFDPAIDEKNPPGSLPAGVFASNPTSVLSARWRKKSIER
jgi:hypothetical protein